MEARFMALYEWVRKGFVCAIGKGTPNSADESALLHNLNSTGPHMQPSEGLLNTNRQLLHFSLYLGD